MPKIFPVKLQMAGSSAAMDVLTKASLITFCDSAGHSLETTDLLGWSDCPWALMLLPAWKLVRLLMGSGIEGACSSLRQKHRQLLALHTRAVYVKCDWCWNKPHLSSQVRVTFGKSASKQIRCDFSFFEFPWRQVLRNSCCQFLWCLLA